MTTATLKSVGHEHMRALLGTFCAGNPGFSVDANANDVETDNAFDYCIDGIWYTNAADAAIDISAEISDLPDALPDGYTQMFVFEVDASGNYTVSAGDQVLTAEITAGTKSVDIPNPSSSSVCPFGMLKVVNASGSDFTLGTTSTAAAGVTSTFYDICRIPASV